MILVSYAKQFILFGYLGSIAYTHFRGQTRFSFLRQLTDHSSFMAPINFIIYWFSAVPKTPYLSNHHFPELQLLRDHWQTIRDEALRLYEAGHINASQQYDDIGFNSFFRRGWKRFYLKWYNDPLPSAQHTCPKTLALIQQIPSVNAAMFALLPKQSYLFKHRDPYAGSVRYHLGLVTPNSPDCCIYVDEIPYIWKDGEDVLFDETYIHHAKNTTETDRIILFCDINRPLTNRIANQFNQFFCRIVMRATASKNNELEQVGVINKSFKYLYQVRLLGKRLKKYNKSLYYLVKYCLYIGLFYFFFLRGN